MLRCFFFCLTLFIASGVTHAGEVRVLLVGDIMLDWRMVPYLQEHGYGYPFERVLTVLQRADIAAGNLEMPIGLEGERAEGKAFAFLGHPRTARAIADAGFDVLTLANNHILDYGPIAFGETLERLREAEIAYCGAGMDLASARKPARVQTQDGTFTFLGYSNTLPFDFHAAEDRLGTVRGLAGVFQPDIALAAAQSDVAIATFHWGAEYGEELRDYQVDFAHRAIRSGAKLVFGHHPHILQGVELFEGGVIAYSLGNFAFGSYNAKAKYAAMMEAVFEGTTLVRVEFIPIHVLNTEVAFQPRILTGQMGKQVIDELNERSQRFGTQIRWDGERGILPLETPPRVSSRK